MSRAKILEPCGVCQQPVENEERCPERECDEFEVGLHHACRNAHMHKPRRITRAERDKAHRKLERERKLAERQAAREKKAEADKPIALPAAVTWVSALLNTLEPGTVFASDPDGGRPGRLIKFYAGSALVEIIKDNPSLARLTGRSVATKKTETWARQARVWLPEKKA